MNCSILCYGEIDLDRYLAIDKMPGIEVAANVQEEFYNVGGAAGNAAVWLAHWGVPVRLAGHEMGDDSYGIQVRQQLSQYPVLDTNYVRYRQGYQTPRCQCLVTPDGERSFIMHWPDQVFATPLTSNMLEGARWLNLDMSGELTPRLEAAKLARNHNISVLVNDVYSEDHPLIGLVDIIIMSASVFERKKTGQSLIDTAKSIRVKGNCDVIVTNGGQPVKALLKPGNKITLQPPNIPAIDTTGSGDIFKAGLLYGLYKGLSVRESLKWAAAAGTAKAGRRGTTQNPADLDIVQRLASMIIEEVGE
jgi:sugar/nucleoside kinase (ribokinase family)